MGGCLSIVGQEDASSIVSSSSSNTRSCYHVAAPYATRPYGCSTAAISATEAASNMSKNVLSDGQLVVANSVVADPCTSSQTKAFTRPASSSQLTMSVHADFSALVDDLGMPSQKATDILSAVERGPAARYSVTTTRAGTITVLPSGVEEDPCVLGELIGRGGYGRVHKGTWRGLAIAVKVVPVLPPRCSSSSSGSFHLEAQHSGGHCRRASSCSNVTADASSVEALPNPSSPQLMGGGTRPMSLSSQLSLQTCGANSARHPSMSHPPSPLIAGSGVHLTSLACPESPQPGLPDRVVTAAAMLRPTSASVFASLSSMPQVSGDTHPLSPLQPGVATQPDLARARSMPRATMMAGPSPTPTHISCGACSIGNTAAGIAPTSPHLDIDADRSGRMAHFEALLMSAISHPNIVTVHKVFSCKRREASASAHPAQHQTEPEKPLVASDFHIVMEYCAKGSLDKAVSSRRFREPVQLSHTHTPPAKHRRHQSPCPNDDEPFSGSPDLLAALAGQQGSPMQQQLALAQPRPAMVKWDAWAAMETLREVASALEFLHAHNILHGDLKAANVLLAASNIDRRHFSAKVADFGLSRVFSKARDIHTRVMGTVSHMPPELLVENRLAAASSDIYAFGVLMAEVFTGDEVFKAMTDQEVMVHIGLRKQMPVLPPDTPPGYRAIAERCWSPVPEQRPSAAELGQMLAALQQRLCPKGVRSPRPVIEAHRPLTLAPSEATSISVAAALLHLGPVQLAAGHHASLSAQRMHAAMQLISAARASQATQRRSGSYSAGSSASRSPTFAASAAARLTGTAARTPLHVEPPGLGPAPAPVMTRRSTSEVEQLIREKRNARRRSSSGRGGCSSGQLSVGTAPARRLSRTPSNAGSNSGELWSGLAGSAPLTGRCPLRSDNFADDIITVLPPSLSERWLRRPGTVQ